MMKKIVKKKFRLMVINQNQILFFNITGANGTDARAENKEIHLKKSEAQNKDTPKQ